MKEKPFENKLKAWLESVGIYEAGTPIQKKDAPQCGWFFKVWGGGFQKAGIPDIIANINGIFTSIELKGDGGKPSQLQIHNTVNINATNGVGLIVYPEDFDGFKELVKGMIKCNGHIQELEHLKGAKQISRCIILTK